MMRKLYRMVWDCGRMGFLEGIFIADEVDVENLIGKTVYFGEVLGKHSEIFGEIERGDITELSDDQEFIDKFSELIGPVGYNPFDYVNE